MKGEKYVQLRSLSLMPALSSWQTIIDAYFPRRVLSHYQKMLIYPALQSTKQHSMAYADVKHSENPPDFVWPYRGDQQLFVLWSSTQNAIRCLWGEKNLWKTIAFTKWRPARREKVDVNQLFEMINTCIRNFKILIK